MITALSKVCDACGGRGYATKDGKWGDALCPKCDGHGEFYSCEGCEEGHGFGAGDYDTKVGHDYHVQELHATNVRLLAALKECSEALGWWNEDERAGVRSRLDALIAEVEK
jgi:hypothetical protein